MTNPLLSNPSDHSQLASTASEANSTHIPNVIVFGESGAGKSSVVNMLDGNLVAKVSHGVVGMTFNNTPYTKTIRGSKFNVCDTVGLNEATPWSDAPQDDSNALQKLIGLLEDGVHLLVHVMRAPRITETTKKNYDMFFRGFCRSSVPIVLVVTGLEDREFMDDWWIENKKTFDQYGMTFRGCACITAVKGRSLNEKLIYEEKRKESKRKLENLIHRSYSHTSWKMPPESWFDSTLRSLRNKTRCVPAGSRTANVIVFGETGVAKSSVINMLDGDVMAAVSDQNDQGAFSNTPYEKAIFGCTFNIFDTIGFDGGPGTLAAREAIEGVYKLIRQLDDGINLLVYVIQASRMNDLTRMNYKMFFELFCQKQVPIVIIVTGLGERDNRDNWWIENKTAFDMNEMKFDGYACIMATKGPLRNGRFVYEWEYEDSKRQVESLIYDLHNPNPWKMPLTTWFDTVVVGAHNIFATSLGLDPSAAVTEWPIALHEYVCSSPRDAVEQNFRKRRRIS
jgi:predicted GTPase